MIISLAIVGAGAELGKTKCKLFLTKKTVAMQRSDYYTRRIFFCSTFDYIGNLDLIIMYLTLS